MTTRRKRRRQAAPAALPAQRQPKAGGAPEARVTTTARQVDQRWVGILLIIIVLLAAALANQILGGSPLPAITPFPGGIATAPLSTEGYREMAVGVSPAIIYLRAGCTQLAMVTTEGQTYSIQNGLDGRIDFRPTVHDVLVDLMDSLGIEVRMARIDGVQDSTYYATLLVQQGDQLLALDTKPSDAIAVAVRTGAPLWVRDSIVATGKQVC
ncbi:MAG: bifunctional nuclease family protein [Candidatus Aenigmarchaeota archaeon]|nr:bifunctional nuclease family protein [Candidatus Aenigmarchaeota archaeon]